MAVETASKDLGACLRTKPLSLAKTCSIGLRSGEYLGRNTSLAPDRGAHRLSFVRAEVVEDHHVAGPEGRDQELLDVSPEALAVDWAVEQAGRFDPVVAERGEEGRSRPAAMGDLVDEPLSLRRPTAKAGHVGLGPSLVDEDEA